MSVTNLYASVEQLASRAPGIFGDQPTDITSVQTLAAETLIEAISRAIDSLTGRHAGAYSPSSVTPEAKIIYGNGENCLQLPDHVPGSIATVTTIAGVTAPVTREYRSMLCMTDAAGVMNRSHTFRDGVPYTISARWGWDATPADIREACLIWATHRARLNSGDMSGVVTTIMRDGATLQRDDIPPTVRDLLKPYVLQESENDRAGRIETGSMIDADTNPYDGMRSPLARRGNYGDFDY